VGVESQSALRLNNSVKQKVLDARSHFFLERKINEVHP
jgi:hypothetical protein